VTLVDIAGNTSTPTTTVFTIDSLLPTTPTITSAGGDVTPSYLTNDSTPTINGTGEPGSVFTIRNASGAVIATGTVDGSGNWTYTPTTPLVDGIYDYSVTMTDAAGNTSPATPLPLTIDTTPPATPAVTAPVNGSLTSDNTPTINGT
jgi:large repetitive protein